MKLSFSVRNASLNNAPRYALGNKNKSGGGGLARLRCPSRIRAEMDVNVSVSFQNDDNSEFKSIDNSSKSPVAQPLPRDGQEEGVIVQDDLDSLLMVLPEDIRETVRTHPNRSNLLEIVLDLGRRPEARFQGIKGGEHLRESEVTSLDLEQASSAVGQFMTDNRAGIEGTLHRISAIRNRKGQVVGLTCRVGRAVTGHIDMIRDLLESPNSLLFLGRPGVGKTTIIRELARVLSDVYHKRVVIVDTSNEIGGDGDVPHAAIGGARRMQVPDPTDQHRIMIEAVENHMPEIVIVDEIGNEAEALACRTIAERGVMLIGTAHGQVIENLIKNPSLSDLIGGIESVTLGDEEARTRGTQKSVLERRAPPTFPLVIEMRERQSWVAHWVEDSVDALLNGRVPMVQVRRRDPISGRILATQERYDNLDALTGFASSSTSSSSSPRPFSPSSSPSSASSSSSGRNNNPALLASMMYMNPSDDDLEGYSGAVGGVQNSDPYSWAQKLQQMPEKDALQEMASLGYLGGVIGGAAGAGGRGASSGLSMFGGGRSSGGSSGSRNNGKGGGGRASAKRR